MFKKITILSAIISLFMMQACSTVFNGGSQSVVAAASGDVENISIQVSTPSGSYRSKIPTTIVTTPSSFSDTEIKVQDKCYEGTVIKVGKSITPSFWANFLLVFWFPVGMGIDFLDGHMWKMDQQVIVPVNKNDTCKK